MNELLYVLLGVLLDVLLDVLRDLLRDVLRDVLLRVCCVVELLFRYGYGSPFLNRVFS